MFDYVFDYCYYQFFLCCRCRFKTLYKIYIGKIFWGVKDLICHDFVILVLINKNVLVLDYTVVAFTSDSKQGK